MLKENKQKRDSKRKILTRISKDLMNMTQEKMIQAFGRVGRSSSQKSYTLRVRNDELIIKLYTKDNNKPNMIPRENNNGIVCLILKV